MKRHVAAIVLAVATVLVIDLHADWRRADNGVLLRVGEQDVDVLGHARQAWTRLSRHCAGVQALRSGDAEWETALSAVRDYSPPDSHSAQLIAPTRQGDWLLGQVNSDVLMPAVVTLRAQGPQLRLVPNGVWSGSTWPWLPTPWVRDYLVRQVPDLPDTLTDCLEIDARSQLLQPAPAPAASRSTP